MSEYHTYRIYMEQRARRGVWAALRELLASFTILGFGYATHSRTD